VSHARTLPTNSCVRVSLGGPGLPSGEALLEVAIWMTASMSSFEGPEEEGAGEDVPWTDDALEAEPYKKSPDERETRAGNVLHGM
jgi:hypothetical protein